MKLYTDIGGTAPSPRRVRMFLAEKGIDVPLELKRYLTPLRYRQRFVHVHGRSLHGQHTYFHEIVGGVAQADLFRY